MPTNNIERFTQRARRVLSLAQEEAEHLLLGLMREEGGIAGRVLRDLGLEQRHVEELVEELTRATARTTNTALDLSPGTKRVLELAVDEARRMGHHYIGTEHLLLALVRQSEGVAIDVLKRLGVSPEEVRRQTRRVLQESPVVQQSPQPPSSPTGSSGAIRRLSTLLSENTNFSKAMQSTILKMLEMIEAEKLTVEQATELLTTLQPGIFLMPSDQTELVMLFKNVPDKRRLRIMVRDKESGATQLEVDVPISKVLSGMDAIVLAVIHNQLGQLWLDESDAHNKLEIRIYDEKPPAESGSNVVK